MFIYIFISDASYPDIYIYIYIYICRENYIGAAGASAVAAALSSLTSLTAVSLG